jgi:hypothetical protein
VIITRFAPDRSAGHGHHEASAILAEEAFDLAGDPKAFPEQLEQGLEVWQPRRLFFNGSTWWKKDLADIAKSDPDWFSVDVGGYDPLLGLSYTEIAGRSRSMHKSQGFGAAETRGESLEYLKLIKGDRPKGEDIFEGIDMTWGRVNDSNGIEALINDLITHFDPNGPASSLDRLKDFHEKLSNGSSSFWSGYTKAIITELAQAVTGLVVEPLGAGPFTSLNDTATVTTSLLSRSGSIVTGRATLRYLNGGPESAVDLKPESTTTLRGVFRDVNDPYWLKNSSWHRPGELLGWCMPVWRGQQTLLVEGELAGIYFSSEKPIMYKWVDRVAGERIRPVYITPVASVIPKSDVLIATGGTQTITVEVEALTDSLTGQLSMTPPPGWIASRDAWPVNLTKRNERQVFTFSLKPESGAQPGAAKFTFSGPKGKADRTLHEIDHPHIMPQVYYTPAEVKLVPLDVKTTARRVGYVKGAGDDVPQAMEQLGVAVEFIEPASAKLEELRKYDAIVTGIRAYNATKGMKELHPLLLRYVEEGGTLIVQYNTTPRFFSGASDFQIDPATLGPKPFTIGRGRVTVEEAPPTFIDPQHPLLNTPNTITSADFEGWVQERGLYFAGDFGTNYTPLIAWNDPGEEPLNGALIVADHGKGRFIYTGISFFRQLPAGVPGAYRLWANLISRREVK